MLHSIGRTARIIQADDPTFTNTFHLPDRESAQAVLTAARVFVRDIDAVAQRFLEHDMRDTFVAELKQLLKTYEEAIRRRENEKVESAVARASITTALGLAMKAVQRLDVLVKNKLRGDADALVAWKRARRVPYPPRHAAETPPDAVPVTAAPAPAHDHRRTRRTWRSHRRRWQTTRRRDNGCRNEDAEH